MDVMCKCGHNVRKHGEWDCSECDCEFGETQVYDIFITEQQARLDTNRAQVGSLSAANKAMKQTFAEIFNLCEETDDMEEALYNISLLCSRHVDGKDE